MSTSQPSVGTAHDPAAVRAVTNRLVRAALPAGLDVKDADVAIAPFDDGAQVAFVGQVEVTLRFAVKIDRYPRGLDQAQRLRHTAADERLPASFRAALPKVYAVDSDRTHPGFLMEDLSGTHEPLSRILSDPERMHRALPIVTGLWAVLKELYERTSSKRNLPNTVEQCVDRLFFWLDRAVAAEPALDDPMTLIADGSRVELPHWREVLAGVRGAAGRCAAPFSSVIHGDPNVWNTLVAREGEALDLRLLDPARDPLGDYITDAATIGSTLQELPLEGEGGFISAPRLSTAHGRTEISYHAAPVPLPLRTAEVKLLELVASFARTHGDPSWMRRYRLTTAALRLGLSPIRLEAGDPLSRQLGIWAFGDGLSTMWQLTGETSRA